MIMENKKYVYRAPELYLENFGYEYIVCTSLPAIPEEMEEW